MKIKFVNGLLVFCGWMGVWESLHGSFQYTALGEITASVGLLTVAVVSGVWLIYGKLKELKT